MPVDDAILTKQYGVDLDLAEGAGFEVGDVVRWANPGLSVETDRAAIVGFREGPTAGDLAVGGSGAHDDRRAGTDRA